MKKIITLLLFGFLIQESSANIRPIEITGIITDELGSPLIGATIFEKGTLHGEISDLNGFFTISISGWNQILVVSYTGYETKEVLVQSPKTKYQIQLNAGALLEEVVIVSKSSLFSCAKGMFKRNNSNQPYHSYDTKYHSPENYKYFEDLGFKSTHVDPLNTMSIDIDRASYGNIRRFLNNEQMPPKDAVRVEEMMNYFIYEDEFEMDDYKDHPIAMQSTYLECPWNDDHRILHISMKAKSMDRNEVPPSNLVFLLDVSGSMNAPNKLPLLKQSFKLLVDNLTEQDRISVVVYAGAAGVVVEGLNGADKPAIFEALDQLEAGGSTAGAAGIKKAYQLATRYFIKGGNNRVILATDGDFNVGVSSEGDLVRLIQEKKETGVFLSVLGFGVGNYQESKMQELAQEGNGNHFYIDDINEAKKSLVTEFGSTLYAVAKDVKLQIEFNPSKVAGYRVIGYENRQLEHQDFNDDTKDAGDLGAGHQVTVLYEIIPVGSASKALPHIDDLKYRIDKQKSSSELATLKCRYKLIDSNRSKKFDLSISSRLKKRSSLSKSIKWSLAVAQFGMLLRNSPHKGNSTFKHVHSTMKKLASNEYEKECTKLVRIAMNLNKITDD